MPVLFWTNSQTFPVSPSISLFSLSLFSLLICFSFHLCLSSSLSSLLLFSLVLCCGVFCAVLLCVAVCRCVVCCCVSLCWEMGRRPCVRSKRPRVCRHHTHMCLHMWTCCRYTRGRFACTHVGFSASVTPHTTPHHTTPHTYTTTTTTATATATSTQPQRHTTNQTTTPTNQPSA